MIKKNLIFFLSTLCATTLALGFSGCHQHAAGEAWGSDATDHWHVCTDCGEKTDVAEHTFDGLNCTVCGAIDASKESQGLTFEYYQTEEHGTGYYVTGLGTCEDVNVVIPEKFNDGTHGEMSVVGVRSGAFNNCTSLEKIVIPTTVVALGYGPHVLYPNFGTTFENVTAEIIFNKSTLKSLPRFTFDGYKGKKFVIPSSVETFHAEVFDDTEIEELHLPSSIASFENVNTYGFPYDGIATLKKLYIDSVESWFNIAFPTDGLEFTHPLYGTSDVEIYVQGEKIDNLVVPASVGALPIKHLRYLSVPKITIAQGVEIRTYENAYCYNEPFMGTTSEIDISQTGLTAYPDYFFGGYAGETVVIPDYITELGRQTFRASKITHIEIPNHIQKLDSAVFLYCTKLASVTFEENSTLTTINKAAFSYCLALKSLVIPKSVTTLEEGNPTMHESAFNNYECEDCNGYANSAFSNGTPIVKCQNNCGYIDAPLVITFEEGSQLSQVGAYAFAGFTGVVVLPTTYTTIQTKVFYDSRIAMVVVPTTVTKIESMAFYKSQYQGNNTKAILYQGTQAQWEAVEKDGDVYDDAVTTLYFYSETAPTDGGNYWHFVNGVPTLYQ